MKVLDFYTETIRSSFLRVLNRERGWTTIDVVADPTAPDAYEDKRRLPYEFEGFEVSFTDALFAVAVLSALTDDLWARVTAAVIMAIPVLCWAAKRMYK